MTYHSNTAEHSHLADWITTHEKGWHCHECRAEIPPGSVALEIFWMVSRVHWGIVCERCALDTLTPASTVKYAFPCVLERIRRASS